MKKMKQINHIKTKKELDEWIEIKTKKKDEELLMLIKIWMKDIEKIRQKYLEKLKEIGELK